MSRCTVDFTVDDNGIGRDEETLGRLFQPFTQADAGTTRRFGGTGLGLSISSGLAQVMSGTITAKSRIGHGSCFTLRLPFDRSSPEAVDEPMASFAQESSFDTIPGTDMATAPMPLSVTGEAEPMRSILVAEDNETNQYVIARQLSLMGYACDIAVTGQEALEFWRRGSYSLLLTDLHMPVMDGFGLTAAIRSEELPGRRLAIVALTADAASGEILRGREVGLDDHMIKPLQLRALHTMLQKWMPPGAQPRPLRTQGLKRAASAAPVAESPRVTKFPVDLDVLKSMVGTDPAVIARMLASFRATAAKSRAAIRDGIATGRYESVANAAHPLKSAARSVGALALAQICDDMELSASGTAPGQLAAQLTRFEQSYADVEQYLDGAESGDAGR